ncbi:MAG: GNAT family N-acetyltransferase [Vicinamibacterales bacterium]
MPHTLEIGLLTTADHDPLRRFLDTHDQATVFYDPRWFDVLRATYWHRTRYWVARRGADIVGAFPVTTVYRPVLGTKHIASPYQFNSGLPLGLDDETRAALVRRTLDDVKGRGGYLEVRHLGREPWLEELGFQAIDTGLVNAVVPLPGITLAGLRHGHRREVQSAEKQGLTLHEDNSREALERFHRMLAVESRAMGNPQGGYRFLERYRAGLPECFHLTLAMSGSTCVGGALTIENRNGAFGRYSVALPEAKKLYVSKAIIWRLLADASARGCRSFSLGISSARDEGLIYGKQGWGAEVAPVWLHVYPHNSVKGDMSGYLDGFQLAKSIWRKLPTALTEPLGTLVTGWVC